MNTTPPFSGATLTLTDSKSKNHWKSAEGLGSLGDQITPSFLWSKGLKWLFSGIEWEEGGKVVWSKDASMGFDDWANHGSSTIVGFVVFKWGNEDLELNDAGLEGEWYVSTGNEGMDEDVLRLWWLWCDDSIIYSSLEKEERQC